jgi:putative membrane protein
MPQQTDFDLSYCGPAPTLANLAGRWNFDPVVIVLLLAIAALGWSWLATPAQKRSFVCAWGLAAILYISPLCALTVALASARVSHHALLAMVALPSQLGRRLPAIPVLILSTIALWVWHWPDFYAASFGPSAVYWAMQITILGSFTALWLVLLRSDHPLLAASTALASAIQMGFLGALLVFAPSPLYAPHFATALGFGLTPLEDQQLAGLIMWVPANLPLLALVLWRLQALLRDRQAQGTDGR